VIDGNAKRLYERYTYCGRTECGETECIETKCADVGKCDSALSVAQERGSDVLYTAQTIYLLKQET
jgi:hypothetical protein